MKYVKGIFAWALLLAILLTGCAETKQENKAGAGGNTTLVEPGKYPQYHAELSNLMGGSMKDVRQALNLEEGDPAFWQMQEADLKEALDNREYGGYACYWKLTNEATQTQKDHMARMEKEYADTFRNEPTYCLDLKLQNDAEQDFTVLRVEFRVKQKR